MKRLYVGNLSWNTKEDGLRAAFEKYGVGDVTVITDHDGRSKGFGFVEVADDQMEAAVAEMNGQEVDGRPLTVNEARPREDRPQRGDFNRG